MLTDQELEAIIAQQLEGSFPKEDPRMRWTLWDYIGLIIFIGFVAYVFH